MNRRYLIAIATVTAALIASPNVYAATSIHAPVSAMFVKTKTIKVTFVNDSGSSMQLKAGDDVVTLEAGKPVTLKLPAGTHVLANTATPLHQAGTLITDISDSLNGATVHIK